MSLKLSLLAAAITVTTLGCATTSEEVKSASTAAAAPVTAAAVAAVTSDYNKPGFFTEVVDGRLWVLKAGEKRSDKHVTWIGAGPNGMTLKALKEETALHYLASKPGFEVEIIDGRVWVLKPGQKRSDKHVTRIGAGPRNTTVKAPDEATMNEYLAAR
jgi:hypothetical protein